MQEKKIKQLRCKISGRSGSGILHSNSSSVAEARRKIQLINFFVRTLNCQPHTLTPVNNEHSKGRVLSLGVRDRIWENMTILWAIEEKPLDGQKENLVCVLACMLRTKNAFGVHLYLWKLNCVYVCAKPKFFHCVAGGRDSFHQHAPTFKKTRRVNGYLGCFILLSWRPY